MIPKRIHCFWFGHGEKNKLIRKCIRSWKKYCPDYQITEWNEDNYDLTTVPTFVRQAIEAGKWAFATDYLRYKVVYDYGGIYLDTDVELVKPLDPFLDETAYFGFESDTNLYVNSGLGFGTEKGHALLRELMAVYETIHFIKDSGQFDIGPCTGRENEVFMKHGLIRNGNDQILDDGVHVFPPDYFCPMNWKTGDVSRTQRTVSIHWYTMSWKDPETVRKRRQWLKRKRFLPYFSIPNNLAKKILSENNYKKLKKLAGFGKD